MIIVSVHIQKTAGVAFGRYLETAFPGGVAYDYGLADPATSNVVRELVERWRYDPSSATADAICRARSVAVIHGHFLPRFYAALLPESALVCWLRDPADRVVSEFNFMRSVEHDGNELYARVFHREITLEQFAEHPSARNVQSRQLDGVPLERFAFVGLVEELEGSLDRFDRRFGLTGVPRPGWQNVSHREIEPDPGLRRYLATLNDADQRLYAQARARLAREAPAAAAPAPSPPRPRLPEGFDPARYRALNPDVTHAPEFHYLNHGIAEGRRWR